MQPASLHQPTFPEKVGKYELMLPIGTGGMATVYLARTKGVGGFERQVALKLVHAHLRADKESKLHLLEEAKLAALIQHPNVIQVLEIDEDPFGVFLVMDYVEGDSLSGLARAAREAGSPLSRRLVARILNDALLGLHAAHELCDAEKKPLGLVHRDFSPQNILVSVQGYTRLGDFGVAKAADRAVRTKTGLTKGKIAYMSPEQARGHAVDRRCDVWAAGVLTWELLARQRLYRSDDDVATLLSIVTEQPPRLSHVLKDVPASLDEAISSALQPQLDSRCPTAEEFRRRLELAWADAEGMADSAELGEFVRRVIGPELVERNSRIEEVKSLRRRMSQLARPVSLKEDTNPDGVVLPLAGAARADAQPSSIPSPASSAVLTPRLLQLVNTVHELPSVPGLRSPPPPAPRTDDSVTTRVPYSTAPERRSRPHDELTETSAVVPTWQGTKPRRKRLALFVAGALGLLGLALWLGNDRSPQIVDKPDSEGPLLSAPAVEKRTAEPPNGAPDSDSQALGDVGKLAPSASTPSADSNAEAAANDRSEADLRTPRGASSPRSVRTKPRPSKGTAKASPGPAVPSTPAPGSKVGPRDKPKLATSPYAGPKSGE